MARVMVDTFMAAHKGQIPEAAWQERRQHWTYEVSERGWRRTLAEIDDGQAPEDRVLVAEADGEIVAVAACHASVPLATATIGSLYVMPAHHRRGVGTALLDAVLDHYRKRGAAVVELEVLAANMPARAFYEESGGAHARDCEIDEDGHKLPGCVYRWDLIR